MDNSLVVTVKNGIVFPKRMYMNPEDEASIFRLLVFFEGRRTTLFVHCTLALTTGAIQAFKRTFDYDLLNHNDPVLVQLSGNLDYIRTFNGLDIPTYSPETRTMTTVICFFRLQREPSTVLVAKARASPGPIYCPPRTARAEITGLLEANLSKVKEGHVTWDQLHVGLGSDIGNKYQAMAVEFPALPINEVVPLFPVVEDHNMGTS
ncbi:hypothetical protein RMATCC62417_12148 [Rhizopus microsporus]|nr:hypothetical protein RMATCC62417_12148 [Rhizopus microsporus]